MSEVGFCDDCGWRHSNLPGCWRKVLREAREKLADPTFTGDLRVRLQAAHDELVRYQQEMFEFFRLANSD